VKAPGTGKEKRKPAAGRPASLKIAVQQAVFWKVFGLFFCFGFCLMAILVHIAPHAIDIGKSALSATGLVATIGISSIAGKIVFGYSGDRIGSRMIYMICFAIMFFSISIPVLTDTMSLLYVFSALFGLAYGGNACSQSPLVAELFGLESHGVIMGAVNTGFTTGATFGPLAAGFLFDIYGSYTSAFFMVGAFAFIGFALGVLLKPAAYRWGNRGTALR
jgi:MFS family permease